MFRLKLFISTTIITSVVAFAVAAEASGHENRLTEASETETVLTVAQVRSGKFEASASRARLPRYMPMYKARNNARYAAYQIYISPDFDFDAYGVGKCRRSNRSRVYCYTWASKDYYDDLGYFIDTMLCDWFTTSSYSWRGRMKIKIDQPDCVWISEI